MSILDPTFEDTICLVAIEVTCLDCGYEALGYVPFGFNPDVKFECSDCGSRNTERD